MIAWLKRLRGMKWSAREDTPDTHLQKAGTPSMGGLGIIGAAVVSYFGVQATGAVVYSLAGYGMATGVAGILRPVMWGVLLLLPFCAVAHAALGLADDWSKATGRGGLRARTKLLGQIVAANLFLIGVVWANLMVQTWLPSRVSAASIPFSFSVPLWLAFTVALLVIVGVSNAVNITDGIDGLAAGLSVQVGLAFLIISPKVVVLLQWENSAAAFWAPLAGACAGFLIFNKHKAQVFMGDTGSLALGAALGAAAVMTRTVFLLPFIGFVFFVEMFSVMLQVAYFKYTRKKSGEGKRIFRRAPLHHHFELGGWSEKRVVLTFWTVNLVATAIGLALWSVGILPRFP
jgi:phospho-N-acetylmuramoyl-pentapeptide-transferase